MDVPLDPSPPITSILPSSLRSGGGPAFLGLPTNTQRPPLVKKIIMRRRILNFQKVSALSLAALKVIMAWCSLRIGIAMIIIIQFTLM